MMFQLPVFYLTAPQLPILHVIAIQMPALHPMNLQVRVILLMITQLLTETAASLSTVGCASTPATTVICDLVRNISPLPKTSSACSKSRKQESAACVWSSPYKNALTKKGETSKRHGKRGGKPKGKRPMPKKKQRDSGAI